MHESKQDVNIIIPISVVVFDLKKKKEFIYMIFATWGVGWFEGVNIILYIVLLNSSKARWVHDHEQPWKVHYQPDKYECGKKREEAQGQLQPS